MQLTEGRRKVADVLKHRAEKDDVVAPEFPRRPGERAGQDRYPVKTLRRPGASRRGVEAKNVRVPDLLERVK